jgi:hypothetical protein
MSDASIADLIAALKVQLRGEGQPGHPGEHISVNEAQEIVDEVFADALEAFTVPTDPPCGGGCDYNSGPEETCSAHGRPVAEVWAIVNKIEAERDKAKEELADALESVTVPSENTALTDAEWREFQAIPDQGYSHRHWVDMKIQSRLPVPVEQMESEFREGYEAWKKAGQATSAALLEIWHMTAGFDTKHMTFGDDPQVVVESVRSVFAVPVEPDERLGAWESVACHPFFDECYSADGTLIPAMLGKLDAAAVEPEWGTEIRDEDGVLTDRDVHPDEATARACAIAYEDTLVRREVTPWLPVEPVQVDPQPHVSETGAE